MDFHRRPPPCDRGEFDFSPRRRHPPGDRTFGQSVQNQWTVTGHLGQIRADVVGDQLVRDGHASFRLEAPYRAEDAATVPVRTVQTDDTRRIKAFILVID